MGDKKKQQVDRMQAYARVLERQAGKAVRPYRADGYMNLLNRYGTSKDSSEAYQFVPEVTVPDESLTVFYEGNGLFAKIIDAPAEEALKHGFVLDDVSDQEVEDFYREALDELDWEETAMTAVKWARLFGGSLAVMLINDGRGLEEPLDWKNIKSIDDIRVYDRSVIQPDYNSMFHYDPSDPFRTRGSRLGMPEFFHVYSKYGNFTVHESRCLVFQNGILPENSTNSIYQFWGMPEYIRINRAIQDAEIAHRSAPKMLVRSVQPIYKMKNLSSELATEEGENMILKRLMAIDTARGMMNSITIDSEGEDYDFRSFQFSGVSDVIDSACNFLSALTNIPQTILFGRSPAGMNSTGESDMENWYNYVERIQKRMIKGNLRYLLSIIFQAGIATGEVDEVPNLKVSFNPLWSMSDIELADLEQKKATTAQTKAQTVQIYVDMQAIDPTEVRRKLADSNEFDVETMLDEYEDEEDLLAAYESELPPDAQEEITGSGGTAPYSTDVDVNAHEADPGSEGSAPANAPAATKLPQDMSAEEAAKAAQNNDSDGSYSNTQGEEKPFSVGVLVVSEGRVLTGTRHNDFGYGLICGPGGHGEKGETPEQAAFRETEEEFGISPNYLIPLGTGPVEPDTGLTPYLFLCTDYDGEPNCVDLEMTNAKFRTLEELDQLAASMFQPFADGLEILKTCIEMSLCYGPDGLYDHFVDTVAEAVEADPFEQDGGPGSGNHGHKGVPGQIGGSAASGFDSDKVALYERGDKLSKGEKDATLGLAGASALGADKTSKVRLISDHGQTRVVVQTDKGEVDLKFKPKEKTARIEMLYANKANGGSGTEVLADIVSNARSQGVEKIEAFGAGTKGDAYNGYYSLPRLGFDGPLSDDMRKAASESGFSAERVSDLMKTEKGRSWWKENGHGMELTFDLSDDSESLKTLSSYLNQDSANISDMSNSENPIDKSAFSGTIKSQETSEDGAPKGNKNAAGPHQKNGTAGRKLSAADKKKYTDRLKGQTSSRGTVVTGISDHAFERVGGRLISPARIESMLAATNTKPDATHKDRTLYDIKGSRLVLADDGTIVSVMWRKQNKR